LTGLQKRIKYVNGYSLNTGYVRRAAVCVYARPACGNALSQPKEATMKLSDLFLPKIARSDPKVREEAVKECSDKDLLKRVIQNDQDERVRKVAIQRLEALQA
jgi:hypothetical protein